MSRDSLKTLAGLVVILLVIGGAFWYGSSQRQTQAPAGIATPTPSSHSSTVAANTATPKVTATPTPKATTKATPKPTPAATPAVTPTPLAGPLPAETPRTGAATDLLPLAALSVAWVLYRRSRLVPERQN